MVMRSTLRSARAGKDVYYFAYGSNMNPARVAERGLKVESATGAVLSGVSLAFNKQSREHAGNGHANMVYAPAGLVEGVLYRLADHNQIELMDRFERAPINYSRERVVVQTPMGQQSAWTYFANRAVIAANLRPTRGYLEHLLAGRSHLSTSYYEWLSEVVCVDR